MEWLGLLWAVVALFAIVHVLGGILAWAIGLRGVWAYAAAPVLAISTVGIGSMLAPFLSVGFTLLPMAVLAVALGVVVRLLRGRFGVRMYPDRPGVIVAALAVAAVVLTTQVLLTIGRPENFSQTFDNVFHLNVVRFILDTANGSSLHVGFLTDQSPHFSFYPAVWHELVALVVQVSGVSIPVAVNATSIAVSAAIWPSGVLLLTRQLFGRNRVVLLSAGILAAALPVFPILLMDYGVLYPFQLGVALLPATLAITLRVAQIGARSAWLRTWQGWLLLAGALPGLFLAHPGAFMAWVAFTVPIVAIVAVTAFRRAMRTSTRLWVVAGVVTYLIIGFVTAKVLRPPSGSRGWGIEEHLHEAALEILTGSVWYGTAAVLASVAFILGVVMIFVRRTRAGVAAAGILLIAAILYIVVSALPFWTLRDILTGSWYNNRPRLAALLPVIMVPIGAYGLGAACVWLRRRTVVRRLHATLPRAMKVGIGAALVLIGVVVSQLPYISPVPSALAVATAGYRVDPGAVLVDSDELALLKRIDSEVPADAVIAGSPWTGTALAYALADRRVIMPHMFTNTTPAQNLINDKLNVAVGTSAVCQAVRDLKVEYVLDFGTQEVHGDHHIFPGLTNLAKSAAVRLVDESGHARLYKVVACGD